MSAKIKKNDASLYVKLPENVKILLTERADSSCLTVSAYIRQLVLADLGLLPRPGVQSVEVSRHE